MSGEGAGHLVRVLRYCEKGKRRLDLKIKGNRFSRQAIDSLEEAQLSNHLA